MPLPLALRYERFLSISSVRSPLGSSRAARTAASRFLSGNAGAAMAGAANSARARRVKRVWRGMADSCEIGGGGAAYGRWHGALGPGASGLELRHRVPSHIQTQR